MGRMSLRICKCLRFYGVGYRKNPPSYPHSLVVAKSVNYSSPLCWPDWFEGPRITFTAGERAYDLKLLRQATAECAECPALREQGRPEGRGTKMILASKVPTGSG